MSEQTPSCDASDSNNLLGGGRLLGNVLLSNMGGMDWIRENLTTLLSMVSVGSIVTAVGLWIVLRRERRESRRDRREARESLAPHIEAFWEATDALEHNFSVRCANAAHGPGEVPKSLLDRLTAAERAVLARINDSDLATAVSEFAGEMRVIAGGRMDNTGKLKYPSTEEWRSFLAAKKKVREHSLAPK